LSAEDPSDAQATCIPICFARFIGRKLRLPPKRNIKAWASLQLALREATLEIAEIKKRRQVRAIHQLEREIVKFESLPADKARTVQIRALKKRLAEMRND
jgi:hypothetical protein